MEKPTPLPNIDERLLDDLTIKKLRELCGSIDRAKLDVDSAKEELKAARTALNDARDALEKKVKGLNQPELPLAEQPTAPEAKEKKGRGKGRTK